MPSSRCWWESVIEYSELRIVIIYRMPSVNDHDSEPWQFGSKHKSSTSTAIAYFNEHILHAMDTGWVSGVAFLDLTKAFDTVNHKIALGVVDAASDWLSSVLANRSQVTCCNNAMSNQDPVSIEVAQGSILGPLLFLIYMNDLPDVLEHCSVTLYAHNTVLSFN